MTTASDYTFMARALRLAANGLCNTDPNPTVGCVIVRGDRVVGEGWTAPPGGPHAERVALSQAGAAASGATVYTTLEPCAHTGRTGPCTEALIAAAVRRVVCAVADPNPAVDGQGAQRLRDAGIEVEFGPLQLQAQALNRGFFARASRGRPWVRCKIAASLDGRTALTNGVSQWITSAASRADVHRWRGRSSAVLTGIGTILADDPSLTARPADEGLAVRQPLRVVADSHLRMPSDAKLLGLDGDVLIFVADESPAHAQRLEGAGATVEIVGDGNCCDLPRVIDRLGELQINDVWVEAGPGLNGGLLAAGLIDEFVFYLAPKLFGDLARGMFSFGELTQMDQAIDLQIDAVRMIGGDLRVQARPSTVPGPS